MTTTNAMYQESLKKRGYCFGLPGHVVDTDCSLCCKRIQSFSQCVHLQCGHYYHFDCIILSKHYHVLNANKNCGSKFDRRTKIISRSFTCPKCIHSANVIKKQFKLSYTDPSYKMCQNRLVRDYEELCKDFHSLLVERLNVMYIVSQRK